MKTTSLILGFVWLAFAGLYGVFKKDYGWAILYSTMSIVMFISYAVERITDKIDELINKPKQDDARKDNSIR